MEDIKENNIKSILECKQLPHNAKCLYKITSYPLHTIGTGNANPKCTLSKFWKNQFHFARNYDEIEATEESACFVTPFTYDMSTATMWCTRCGSIQQIQANIYFLLIIQM